MLNWFATLLASISSLFIIGADRPNVAPPLNTAIIAYQETYYAPVVADLENFPWAKTIESTVKKTVAAPVITAPIVAPAPPAPTPAAPPAPVTPPQDPYLVDSDPTTNWYMPTTFRGSSGDSDGATRTLPEMTFNRELWRIEILAYWSPGAVFKPAVEKDYFKLEVYEKGTDKLIHTMTSGTEDLIHKSQAFKRPGTYYFKIFLKSPSQFEVTFTFAGDSAQ